MKTFFVSLKTSFIVLIILTILLGIIYPLFMYGVGQVFFHKQANGTLYHYKNGKVIVSGLIGQNFSQPQYFQPRPSSAGNGYDASNSSGSNLGPTSQKLHDALASRVAAYRTLNNLSANVKIPSDAVTGSGSGLDPHISYANAMLQSSRVASARNLTVAQVKQLIGNYTEGKTFGLFGQERVNVLRINLALDKLSAAQGSL
jgi:K+-transporting ATPase ATPase C chain